MSKERMVVLGSNCFTGVHFIRLCLAQGYDVLGINRSSEPHPIMCPHHGISDSYRFAQLDINQDMMQIKKEIDSFQPSYVVNFAAQGMVGQSWQAPLDWFRTNTLAMVELHEILRQSSYLKRYFHCSTPEVYGNCSGHIDEDTRFSPSSPYAVSKAAADMSLLSFYRAYQFPVVFTRAANVYGPCQQLYRIIPRTIIYFLTGKTLELHGGGTAVRSFIHIDDVARGTLEVLLRGTIGEAYHLATDQNISIRDLVYLIAEKMNINPAASIRVVGDRLGKDDAYLLNTQKIQSQLGWTPKISLETGIEQCISWVQDNLEAIQTMPLEYIHKQ